MGYEIIFSCHEKKEDGSYDMSTKNTFKKVLGKMDDIPVEEAAALIMRQMARRDVLVAGVEIFEYTKKSVNFREVKDGIVIKGKKFNFSGNVTAESQEPVQEEYEQESTQMPTRPQPVQHNLMIKRMEVFDPDDSGLVISMLNKKGINMTFGKNYPIFEEKTKAVMVKTEAGMMDRAVMMYKISDDSNRVVELPSTYFHPPTIGLTYIPQGQPLVRQEQQQARLTYMGNNNLGYAGSIDICNDNGAVMPVLKRGR